MDCYTVTRDGETLATFDTESEAWAYLLGIQGNSVVFAVKYEGYDITYPTGLSLSYGYRKAGR